MRHLKFLAVPAVLLVAALALAATKFPSVVLSRANLASYTSTVAATLGTAEVVEWGHFGFWQYSASSAATPDGNSVIEPSDNPASGRWLLQSGTINGSVSYSICASGCNFSSVQGAVNAISAMSITSGAQINLDLPCHATLTSTTPVIIFPLVGGSLYLTGCAHTNYSATSVVSSSGSSGAWSITLQLSSGVSSIAADNDFVIITGASGGTNPTRLVGVWPVTAVNTGSNQITIATTNRAAAAPSGAVTATVADLGSVLQFNGSSGVDVWAGASVVNLQDVVIAGNGTASTNGLDVEDNGRAYLAGDVGVYDFGGYGVFANLSSEINNTFGTSPLATSDNGTGIYMVGAVAVASPCISSGNAFYGIGAANVAMISCVSSVSGNGSDGINASLFSMVNPGSGSYSNDNGGWGINSSDDISFINGGTASESGNTSGSNNNQTSLPGALALNGTILCKSTLQCDGLSRWTTSGTDYVGTDDNAIIGRNGNDLLLQTFSGYGIDLLGGGVEIGAATGGVRGSGTLNILSGLYANGTAGVTCSGTPTSSFATVGGIVTHC